MGLLSSSAVWPTTSSRSIVAATSAPGPACRHLRRAGEFVSMSRSTADRRSGRSWRLLIGLQVSLLVFTLVAPIGTMAADPDPSDPPPPRSRPHRRRPSRRPSPSKSRQRRLSRNRALNRAGPDARARSAFARSRRPTRLPPRPPKRPAHSSSRSPRASRPPTRRPRSPPPARRDGLDRRPPHPRCRRQRHSAGCAQC